MQGSDLALSKSVDDASPRPGQRITYTIGVDNVGVADTTNATISDTLPAELAFVEGSVALQGASGTIRLPGTDTPLLAQGLSIGVGRRVTLTFAVTVSVGLDNGAVITNTAAVTATEISGPRRDSQIITVTDTKNTYLPLVLRVE